MASILVVYYSKTGNTEEMAELVAEGAREQGSHDVRVDPVQELELADFLKADGYAIGSPDYFSYVAGQIKTLFDEALAEKGTLKGRSFVAFISHGGGGRAIDSLESLSKSIGLNKVVDGLKCENAPEGESAEACRQLGVVLAKELS